MKSNNTEWLKDKIRKNMPSNMRKKIVTAVKYGEYEGVQLKCDQKNHRWVLNTYSTCEKKWVSVADFNAPLDADAAFNCILDEMSESNLSAIDHQALHSNPIGSLRPVMA